MKHKNIGCKNCFVDKEALENNEKVIKYGKQGNKQRYKCKVCGRVFVARDKIKLDRTTTRIMSLLLNLLENDFFGKDELQNALNSTEKYYKNANKVEFDTKYVDKNGDFTITCFSPKLLICAEDKKITFIQIPPAKFNQSDPITEQKREIKIVDTICAANIKTSEYERYKTFLKDN